MKPEGERKNRRWSDAKKHKIVDETYDAGATVASVARKYNIPSSQLSTWRSVIRNESITDQSNNIDFPKLEMAALKERIGVLEKLLGRKSVQLETLQEELLKIKK